VGVALGDHVLGGGHVFLEGIRLPVRVQRRCVVINLKNEYVVRVLLRHRDEEIATARLMHRGGGVLLQRSQVIVDLARHDVFHFCSLFGGEPLESRENVSLSHAGSVETAAPDGDETVQGIGWRAGEDVLLSRLFAGLIRRRHPKQRRPELGDIVRNVGGRIGPKKLR
jgi:hypothetical protein